MRFLPILIHDKTRLSFLRLVRVELVRHVIAAPLEVDWRRREQLAQSRRFAVRADGHRRIIEAAPELELGAASVAVVRI